MAPRETDHGDNPPVRPKFPKPGAPVAPGRLRTTLWMTSGTRMRGTLMVPGPGPGVRSWRGRTVDEVQHILTNVAPVLGKVDAPRADRETF